MILKGLRAPQPILPSHDISAFRSGVASLDEWLRGYALKSEGTTARTYVACVDNQVAGYYCLATGAVSRTAVPRALRPHGTPNPVPVVLVGRLAVDEQHQRRGIASGMLRDAMQRTLSVSRVAGCAAIVVHVIDGVALAFYARFGFSEFPAASRTLFLPIKSIEAGI